jgi:hypothetical protein
MSFEPTDFSGWGSCSEELAKLGTLGFCSAELDGLEKYFWMQDQCNI